MNEDAHAEVGRFRATQLHDADGNLKPEHVGNDLPGTPPRDDPNHYLKWINHLVLNLPNWDGDREAAAVDQMRMSLAWMQLNAPEVFASDPRCTRALEMLRALPRPEPTRPLAKLRDELSDQVTTVFSPETASTRELADHYRALLRHLDDIIPTLDGDRLAEAKAERVKAISWLEANELPSPPPAIKVRIDPKRP